MGGDHAPKEIVLGAIEAKRLLNCEIILYGDEAQIRKVLGSENLTIVHCTQIVTNLDKPVMAIRDKTDSSLVRGLLDLKEGRIQGFLSAGSTGALLAGGLLRVGRLKGIDRPAIATAYPMRTSMGMIVDAGANADCKPEHLRDFALMGSLYASHVLGIKNPRVGVVNIGEEPGKGNELVKSAYPLIEAAPLNFVGSIEGRDIPEGKVDVIVTDGFTGNVILKLSEGLAMSFSKMIKDMFKSSLFTMASSVFFKKAFQKFKAHLDYTEYGGAPLLGVNGVLVKAHGSSNAKAIKNGILYMEKYASSGVIEAIRKHLETSAH